MVRLGFLLHQIGYWKVLDDGTVNKLKDDAKMRRNEVIDHTGMRYTGIVDQCLSAKEEYCAPQKQAKKIYSQVFIPLQGLIDEVKWDFT